MKKQMFKEYDV